MAAGDTLIVRIDLAQIVANWQCLRDHLAPCQVAAVIKADGYGLGAVPIAIALAKAGCQQFFVARVSEAVTLRQALDAAGYSRHPHTMPQIAVLDGCLSGTMENFTNYALTPVINHEAQLHYWLSQTAAENHANAMLHLDTGINRLGFTMAELPHLTEVTRSHKLKWQQVMSHLACDDQSDHPTAINQLARFAELKAALPNQSYSLVASSGVSLGSEHHHQMARVGIGLYGIVPIELNGKTLPLKPAISIAAQLLQWHRVPAGDTIGYGGLATMPEGGKIAVLGVGYADFLPRSVTGAERYRLVNDHGESPPPLQLALGKHRFEAIGRVSMDLLTIDCSAIPDAELVIGDWVEIVGSHQSISDVAHAAATTSYEIITRLSKRAIKQYSSD